MHKFLILFTLLIQSLSPQTSSAIGFGDSLGISPFDEYQETLSPHFRIVYPKSLSASSKRVTELFEEAHALLAPRLFWEAGFRVNILCLDNEDAANGLTSPMQRFGIVLLLTPPENWFSTSYTDDWLRLLVIHEYAHYLNMDATRGVWKGLRYVFGDTLLPVATWPSWMLEGLAVYFETELTRAGRGRSPYWEMILRTAVYRELLGDAQFVSLDQVTGENPYFPGGETRYLFGYHLMNQVVKESQSPALNGKTADRQSKIENPLGLMSYRASHRFPYFINSNLENIVGKDWQELWSDWLVQTRSRMSKEIAALSAQKPTPLQPLTQSGYQAFSGTPSPNGKWIAYHRDSLDRRSGLYLLETSNVSAPVTPQNPGERINDKLLGGQMSWSPDSRYLFFTSLRRYNLYKTWSELGVYDTQTKSTQWLTRGGRIKDPDVSPDGKWIAFTKTFSSYTTLARAPLSTSGDQVVLGLEEVVAKISQYDRAASPRFSPNGQSLVFSLARNGTRGEDLMQLDLESRNLSVLYHQEGTFNRNPAFDAQGKLYFISDQSGVYNLYRLDSPGKAARVSHTYSGLWMPSFFKDKNQYVASHFNIAGKENSGWDLVLGSVEQSFPTSNTAAPFASNATTTATAISTATTTLDQEYSAWRTLAPRQWAPIFFATPDYTYFGGQILGFDNLDRHSYFGLGAYDTYSKKGDWLLAYGNRTVGPTFFLTTQGSTDTRQDLGAFKTYYREIDLGLTGSYPILWTFSSLQIALSLKASREYYYASSRQSGTEYLLGQSQSIPYSDLTLNYSNLESSKLAISAERGFTVTSGVRLAHTYKGFQSKTALASKAFLPLGAHHVLVPSLETKWTSLASTDSRIGVLLDSSQTLDLGSLTGSSPILNKSLLNGYGLRAWSTRALISPQTEYRFPLSYIFRGWNTYPVFIESLTGFLSATQNYLVSQKYSLPSVGGGVRLNTQLLVHLPVVASLEYHQGLNQAQGGEGQWLLSFGLGSL